MWSQPQRFKLIIRGAGSRKDSFQRLSKGLLAGTSLPYHAREDPVRSTSPIKGEVNYDSWLQRREKLLFLVFAVVVLVARLRILLFRLLFARRSWLRFFSWRC
jgi:hypothetical protein